MFSRAACFYLLYIVWSVLRIIMCGPSIEIRHYVVNATVRLPCKNSYNNTFVQWIRKYLHKPSKTYSIGWNISRKLQNRERFRIIGSVGGPEYDLEIADVTREDAGLYSCAVKGDRGLLVYNYMLQISDELMKGTLHIYFNPSTVDRYERLHLKNKNGGNFQVCNIATGMLETTDVYNLTIDSINSSIPSSIIGGFQYEVFLGPSLAGCVIVIFLFIALVIRMRQQKSKAALPNVQRVAQGIPQPDCPYVHYEEISDRDDELLNSTNNGDLESPGRQTIGNQSMLSIHDVSVQEHYEELIAENRIHDSHVYQECGNTEAYEERPQTSKGNNHIYDECDKVTQVYQPLIKVKPTSVHIYN